MPDLQSEMSRILESEREQNNLERTRVVTGRHTPDEVKRAKVNGFIRLTQREGMGHMEASRRMGIHYTTAYDWMKKLGMLKDGRYPHSGHHRKYTMPEMRSILKKHRQLVKSGSTANRAAEDLGISPSMIPLFKKRIKAANGHSTKGHVRVGTFVAKPLVKVHGLRVKTSSIPISVEYAGPSNGHDPEIKISHIIKALVDANVIHSNLKDRVENILLRSLIS